MENRSDHPTGVSLPLVDLDDCDVLYATGQGMNPPRPATDGDALAQRMISLAGAS